MTAKEYYETWRRAKFTGSQQAWSYANHSEVCEFAEAYADIFKKALEKIVDLEMQNYREPMDYVRTVDQIAAKALD